MQKKNVLKGVLFVGIGASIYGMLATFVKLAYQDGYTTSEVTTSQFVLGLIGLLILNFIQTITSKSTFVTQFRRSTKLTVGGYIFRLYKSVLLYCRSVY